MKPFPVHFAIDLEPDERLPQAGCASMESAGVALERMDGWRDRLRQVTGAPAHFGWYLRMDRHIEALYGDPCAISARYRSGLAEAAAAGDEVGLHIHCIEQTRNGGWRANYARRNIISDNIDFSAASFESFFGRRAAAARMGDMWTDDVCRRRLAESGVRYDLTLETGLRPQGVAALYPGTRSKGWRKSMLGASLAPFETEDGDNHRIWSIPLASARRRDFHHPGFWIVSAYSGVTTGFRRARARMMIRPQQRNTRRALRAAFDSAFRENRQPGFCFAIRNFGAADCVEMFLESLCEIAGERPLRFCAPEEYVRLAAGPV